MSPIPMSPCRYRADGACRHMDGDPLRSGHHGLEPPVDSSPSADGRQFPPVSGQTTAALWAPAWSLRLPPGYSDYTNALSSSLETPVHSSPSALGSSLEPLFDSSSTLYTSALGFSLLEAPVTLFGRYKSTLGSNTDSPVLQSEDVWSLESQSLPASGGVAQPRDMRDDAH